MGLCLSAPIAAQSVDGVVLDELTRRAVPHAAVSLLDADGDDRAQTTTDERGRFVMSMPPGEYRFVVEAVGYRTLRSVLLRLGLDAVYPLELLVRPEPVEIEGLAVDVDSEEELLRSLGLRPELLGRRVIRREAIAKRQSARDIGEVLEWEAPPGVTVVRLENAAALGIAETRRPSERLDLCVAFPRGTSFDGARQCALFALNGLAVPEDAIAMLDPEDVETIIVLTPPEASLLFGTGAYGGAVMIYTRRGSR